MVPAVVVSALTLAGGVATATRADRAAPPRRTLATAGLAPVPSPSQPRTAAPSTVAAPAALPRAVTTVPSAQAIEVQRLAARLDAVLVNTDTCLEVREGSTVLYHHSGAALAPASTQKLLVAAAVLDVLGPSHRFSTSVVAVHAPLAGEVDDLWLVGGGDPVLASPDFTAYMSTQPATAGPIPTTQMAVLADQLSAAGVRIVPGGIHGDDSRYDQLRFLPSWKPVYAQEADVAPLGALEVDDGLDSWHPNRLTTDPAAHAAGVLARLAGGRGITVAQGPDAPAPPGAVVLATVLSPPLADVVASMLRTSDNTTAELLVRELDRARGGTGTTAGGTAVVTAEAAHLGLPTAGLDLADGSGLSPDDRATCDVLIGALALSGRAPFSAIGTGLAVAGRSGTLVHRFGGTPAEGHLAAKTGSISGVAGMVGVLDEHQPVAFALLANGDFGYLAGSALQDRVVAALGTYPETSP